MLAIQRSHRQVYACAHSSWRFLAVAQGEEADSGLTNRSSPLSSRVIIVQFMGPRLIPPSFSHSYFRLETSSPGCFGSTV
jgi:hypothetical protein